jgi:hypothetical protein
MALTAGVLEVAVFRGRTVCVVIEWNGVTVPQTGAVLTPTGGGLKRWAQALD